jgi:hypothetical protein
MKRAEIQARAQKNSRSGTIITMQEPVAASTNTICKKCNTPAAAAAAAAVGATCCLGSMGFSAPVTATAAVAAASLGAYSAPKIEKMIKREGGKKNKNKTKKYYKNKRTRKNKKHYKTKKNKKVKY